jgi:putative ABC transport system permease protein
VIVPVIREWILRLLGTLRRRRDDADLQDELRVHIELAAEDAQRRGESLHEARRTARLRSGGALQALDALRDQRGISWADELMRDVRHGLRTLRRTPSFTAVAVMTLALGTGANAAIYQLLDAIRLRPLPVEAPEQLAIVQMADMARWTDMARWSGRRSSAYPVLTHPLWEHFRDHQTVFQGVFAWSNAEVRLDRSRGARPAKALLVSGDFFNVLGVDPYLGRLLTRDDDQPGCGVPTAVLSHSFWQRELGGDPSAIGRTLMLNARPLEVVGVTSPGFFGVEVGRAFDVAAPICAQASLGGEPGWLTSKTMWWLTVMGRTAPEQSLDSVNERLKAISPGLFQASLPAQFPRDRIDDYLSLTLQAVPGATGVSAVRTSYADPLLILQLTTSIVLLMACTNLANLVLARASAREREFAVRLAMGGSWLRLVRQLMVENAMLALGGAIVGVAVAVFSSRMLIGQLGRELSLTLPLDWRLLGVMLGLAFVTCLTFGLVPAWRASRVSAADTLKANGRGASGGRDGTMLRRVLVVTQVACSVLLLFGGVLFALTLRNLHAVDVGFESRNVSIARVDFTSLPMQPLARRALAADLLDRIREAPGVESAAEVRHVPFGGTGNSAIVAPESDPAVTTGVRLNGVTPRYLATVGVTLLAGRDFDSRDSVDAPKVTIVNRTFARRLGLADNPVGQRFLRPASGDVFEVIGLVPDSKYGALREDSQPIMIVPLAQMGTPRPFTDFMVRSALPLSRVSSLIDDTVAQVSPLIAVDVHAFETTIRNGLVRERLMALLSGTFGVLAALIAAIGLYGVMSYLVVRRTNEIGVRVALGARRADVLTLLFRETGALLAVGLAIGAGMSLAAAGSVRALVFGLEPHSPLVIGLACTLLALIGFAASYLPARRAANLPPLLALREE